MWRRQVFLAWMVLSFIGMAGCRPSVGAPTGVPPTGLPQPTASAWPTSAPTPTQPPAPEGVLLALEPVPAPLEEAAWQALTALGEAAGLAVTRAPSVEALPPGTRLVWVFPAAQGAAVAQALPEQRVFIWGPLPADAPPNLYALDGSAYTPQRLAFAAGYLAALATPDYRVGALLVADEGVEARTQALVHGMAYYCGLCRPAFPPFGRYPVWAALPPDRPEEAWRQAADALAQEHGVTLVYVEAEAIGRRLQEAGEATEGWHFLGMGYNPGVPAPGHLMAGPDLREGLLRLWEQAQQGGAPSLRVPFVVQGLSPGKTRWAQETLERLWQGEILP